MKNESYRYGDRVSTFRFSKVDILIPFHGQYGKVRKLVESILLFTKSNPYLVTLIDDGSMNASFAEQIKMMAPVRVIRQEEHRGFASALKAGFEATVKPWVVFLHSDCRVQDHHWLQRLGETMLAFKKKNVKLVHARTNNPCTEHSVLRSTQHEERHEDIIVTEDEPLPLICAMVHRELFSRLGGFIKEYPYGGYEDVELFWRMKKFGMKQAVCGGSWVHHDGGSTINEIIARDKKVKQIMESNYDLCMADLR